MLFREAITTDIRQIQLVRNAVKENVLSDPSLVSDEDCETYMTVRGKAWVCEVVDRIVGFAFIDLKENNIWALFVHPDHAGMGIGKKLHDIMLGWYFGITDQTLWLGTATNTRAAMFYKMQGWHETGKHGKEIKFEMKLADWRSRDRLKE